VSIAPLRSSSQRGWAEVLSRPARPTPWYVWLIATVAAIIGGYAVTSVKTAVIILGAAAVVWMARTILAYPHTGMLFAFALFPFYTLFRGIAQLHKLPLPMSILGMWPEAVLSLMLVSIVISRLRQGEKLRLAWYDAPALLLLGSAAYALLLTLIEKAIVSGLYGVHTTMTGILFYFVVRWLPYPAREKWKLLGVMLLSFVLLAFLSLADYVLRPNYLIEVAIIVREGFWRDWDPHEFFRWYPRMQSLMFAEQLWGTVCAIVSILCLAMIGQRMRRWWLMPLFLLSTTCLMLSMSRGAMVCWGIAAAVMFCFRGRHRLVLVLALAAIVAFFAYQSTRAGGSEAITTLTKRVTALTDTDNDLAYDRVNQWKYALQNVPLFPAGRGLGRAGASALFHGTGDGSMAIVDGGYFKILAEQGIPGILMFVVGAVAFLAVFLERLYHLPASAPPEDRAIGITVFCLFCGLLIHNFGGNIFDAFYVQPLFWMLAGLFISRWESLTAAEREAISQGRFSLPAPVNKI
jgi:hypothetical protein